MSDVSVKLGATFADDGIQELIEDVRESQQVVTDLAQRFKDLGASSTEASAGMKLLGTDSTQTSVALKEVYASTENVNTGAQRTSTGFGSLYQDSRALRVGMAGLV